MPQISVTAPESLQQQMAGIVRRWTRQEGHQKCSIEGLELFRSDAPTSDFSAVYEPSLCFIIQGSKVMQLGDREISFEPLTYMASSVYLPLVGGISSASPEFPYLAVKLAVRSHEVAETILELGENAPRLDSDLDCTEKDCGLCRSPMDQRMQSAVYRLLSLLDSPEDIPVLSKLVRREIIYLALVGELGPRMHKFAISDSQANRISKVIATLTRRYAEPLRIRELADAVYMSESTLHHSFKQVTRMSPLQFQKKLRLHEARRLMLAEGLEAATASYRVGYESPSHFSREYSRMFGAPPRADLNQFRVGRSATLLV